jgi:hypothetical protein
MQGYASPQPVDRFGNIVQPEQSSPAPALTQVISGALVSSIIALDGRATVLEVTTGNGPVGLKWFGSVIGSNNINPSVTVATADNFIPANWTRRFVIPISVAGVATAGSIVGGYGSQNGLYTQVAVINLQATVPTSIFTSQFV